MSAKAKVIENLQTALSMELAAVNQYLLHALVVRTGVWTNSPRKCARR